MIARFGPHHQSMLAVLQLASESATPWHWVVVAFTLLGEVLALIFIVRVLERGGAPATTLMWVVVILLAPWFGIGLYYLFPRRLQLRRLKRIAQQQRRWRGGTRGSRTTELLSVREAEAQQEGSLHRLLRGLVPDGVSFGNAVRWLPSGEDFFAAARLAMARAQHFVHIEIYIFRPDPTGLAFLALLESVARRGVAVRLLYDSLGSFSLKARHLAALRKAGGRAEPCLPLLWKRRPFTVNLRNHRKQIIVDGDVVLLGGRNIADEYATDRLGQKHAWFDAMVQIQGPAVADLHHVFLEDWFNATDEDLQDPRFLAGADRKGNECVGAARSGPDGVTKVLWFSVFQVINDARYSLEISSPYLVPPPSMLIALVVAASRGVRVRIFTNGRATEAVVLHQAQRSYYRELVSAGVEIYETIDDYNHAKVLVADNRTVMVGSANFDMRSAHLNFELAVVLPDSPSFARDVLATLDSRALASRRIELGQLRNSRLQRIIDGICRLLSPIL